MVTMTDENIFKGLKSEHPIDELVKYNELTISEEIQKNPGLIVKYRDLYHKSLAEMDRLNDLQEKLAGKRYHHYKFESDEVLTKVEIEKFYLPSDEKMVKMKKIIRRQEIRMRFFEMCWKAFEGRTWSMKLFMETLKGY
jgi:hypothetical protein